ncbi:MAG: septal ring lytic transglycosylase RlpA family protein [Rhodocyclaceae bacterium]
MPASIALTAPPWPLPQSLRRLARHLPLLACLLLLAACATAPDLAPQPTPPSAQKPPRSAGTTPTPASKAPSTAKRGGGYYKDDGPDDNPPDNLADVPDAQPRLEPLHRFANRPYVALGQSFTPMQQLMPYTAQGIGSWYGKKFHGANTSSGEAYDMYAMTAAHPTLPIPSYARVTNLENGRSVIVRVNDRGPFHANRVIDLSYTAAWKLGYVNKGSARVEVTAIMPGDVSIIAEAPATPSATVEPAVARAPDDIDAIARLASAGADDSAVLPGALPTKTELARGIFLQLGAFSDARNADNFRDYVQTELKWLPRGLEVFNDEGRYRLQLGPFDSAQAAHTTAERIAQTLRLRPFIVQR